VNQIFVFTAGIKAAREHIEDSIVNPVDFGLIQKVLPEDEVKKLLVSNENSKEFYCWGSVPGPNNEKNWNKICDKDMMLAVYANSYKYISRVVYKVRSSGLAELIWGMDGDGETWEYMYFLTRPKAIELPLADVPMGSSPYGGYRGFTRISDNRISEIKAEWGSLSNFFNRFFGFYEPQDDHCRPIKIEGVSLDLVNFSVQADTRVFVEKIVALRQDQAGFRAKLLIAYGNGCCVTGCSVDAVLEAAHIVPYSGIESNNICNGLILRADIHALYDRDLLSIAPDYSVHLSKKLKETVYGDLEGMVIRFPRSREDFPSQNSLRFRHNRFLEINR